jgi:hypothetical protein
MPKYRIQNFALERDGLVLCCPFMNRLLLSSRSTESGFEIDYGYCGPHCPHFHLNSAGTVVELCCVQRETIIALENPVESSEKQPAIVSN